jgi:hypothetical protein
MEVTIVRLIEQLPLSVGVLLIMFWLGRRFLGIWEKQVASRDIFLTKLLDRYSTLDSDTAEVKAGVSELAKQLVILQDSTDAFAGRMAVAFTSFDTIVKGWASANAEAMQANEVLQTEQTSEIVALREELSSGMGKLEKSNHDVFTLLETYGKRLNQLIAILEQTNRDKTSTVPQSINTLLEEIKAAVDKVSTQQEMPAVKPEDNA